MIISYSYHFYYHVELSDRSVLGGSALPKPHGSKRQTGGSPESSLSLQGLPASPEQNLAQSTIARPEARPSTASRGGTLESLPRA